MWPLFNSTLGVSAGSYINITVNPSPRCCIALRNLVNLRAPSHVCDCIRHSKVLNPSGGLLSPENFTKVVSPVVIIAQDKRGIPFNPATTLNCAA